MGLQRNTPPFSYAPTGDFRPVGYSVDLAHLVLARVFGGADRVPPLEAVEVTSSTREGQLADGLIDIECGSTTITEARQARHAFSRPIFRTSHRIVVKAEAYPSPSGALRVVGIQGSTSQAALEGRDDVGFEYAFVGVPSIGAAWEAFLGDRNIGAMVADEVILRTLLQGGAARADLRLLDVRLGGEFYGFMMRHEDKELVRAVDEALEEVFDSIEYRELLRSWFFEEIPGLGFGLEMSPTDEAFVHTGDRRACREGSDDENH
ncbi:transporter substrate-binding domain-containing protein [Streptomyces sp. NBC_01351]|uniref:substrate-binding periplasmic protein n=1 Tax=Streptomyces sp. NBC_01351 TaxID=2903833 RepID=UPI002E33737A|nr:transporter substrate-binding domain-containing protein [Streptomyces sp. NBC_01351]